MQNPNKNSPPRNPLNGSGGGNENRPKNGPGGPVSSPRRPRIPGWVVVALLVVLAGWYFYQWLVPHDGGNRQSVPYSVVLNQVDSDNVSVATITDSTVEADLKNSVRWDDQ